MNCPNCRSENSANAKFCLNCGVPLKHQCANCKTDLPAGARFCMNCGQPVNVTTTTDDARLTRLTAATPAPLASKIRAAHLAGERKIVTAVFADVVGSTAMAEKMDPDDWTTIMNRAFDRISPTIYKYEGTIARLMGDAILAFFGAPVAHEDDPVRAIRASLDLLQAAKEYAEEAKRTYGIDFAMRVGLNTGPVVVGEVGSDLKYEYTAMGDAINLAARMQSAAKPMTVLISEHTYKFVAPIFDFNDLGDIAAYQSLSDLARQRGDQALELAALMERVPLHATPTPLQDAALSHQLMQQALDLAHDIGDRSAEAKINWNLMMTELFGGEIDRAVQYGEQSLAIAREYDLRDQLPFTLNDLAFTYIFHGQMQRGLAAMQEVQELWRAQHNLPMLADSLANAAVSHFYTGHFDRALALGREGARISESINNVWGQSHTYGMLGYKLQEIGHFGEALQLWIASVETGERSGLLATRVGIRSDLGWLYYLLGRIDLAIEQMQRAQSDSESVMPIWHAWPAATLARLYIRQGRLDDARAVAGQYLQDDLGHHFTRLLRSGAVNVALVRGELAYADRDYGRVLEMMDELIAILKSIEAGPFLDDARLLKAQALRQLNRLAEARSALAQARSAAEAIGSHRIYWQVLAQSSEVEAKLGNAAEADRFKQRAKAEIDFIASQIDLEEFRSSFLNQPQVRSLLNG